MGDFVQLTDLYSNGSSNGDMKATTSAPIFGENLRFSSI
jgi:hypothetical protein